MKGYVQIFTYGCQMNDLDTEKMYSLLAEKGWVKTESTGDASLIVLNTCSVRQKAYEKALSNIGRLRPYKRRNPSLVIVVTGCIAQQKGTDIIERMPHVDIVLGTHQLHRIADTVEEKLTQKSPLVDTRLCDCIPSMDIVPGREFIESPHRAYINIMQGCDNFCSYCIVPYVRGREVSRGCGSILDDIRTHALRGVREIFLLGQNVNSYAGGIRFAELLHEIDRIDGIERIRFTTSHPKDMSDELTRCFATLKKLCSAIHLPFQSGSDAVLENMNRHYTKDAYLNLIRKLRSARPDMAFSADVIVGFPGETEEDYRETVDLIKEVRFDVLYSFKYSPRPGTKAAFLEDSVPLEDKNRRLTELQAIQRRITLDNNRGRMGKVFEVLVDGMSARNQDQVYGRTTHNTIVNFQGPQELTGKFVQVKITKPNPNSLTGELVSPVF